MNNLNLKTVFILLISGFLFYWPGIVAYHNPRYINAVYPILIFLFVYCVYLFSKLKINKYFKNIVLFIVIVIALFGIKSGIYNNLHAIKYNAQNSLIYKSKFETFFNKNKFNKDNNFIVFGSPFVSDIAYIFKIFLNNLDTRVAYIRQSSLAEYGCMGCRASCKIKNVKSEFKWVRENNKLGFRLISLDPKNCGWWIGFSSFPLKWSESERAYIWTDKEPEFNIWHKYSMGEFKIHKREKTGQLTDVTYLIDNKWLDKNTVFVSWDSVLGEFKVVKNAIN